MDFELHDTPEMAEFRKEVSAYFQEVIPKDIVISAYSEDYSPEQMEKRREIGRKLGAKGWLYPTWPKEVGGAGLTGNHAIVIEQEIDKYELSNPPYYDSGGRLGGADILIWGSEEQKQTFLRPMVTGQVVTWQLLTEPHGGSDLASTKTLATRDGDEYVLNGTKTFVGSSESAPDFLWTITLTDAQGPRHQNLSWFVIPADLPGITIHALDLLGGESGTSGQKCSVFFEDVRVPAFNLIGGENNGWKVANTHLELEHGGGGSVNRNRQMERFFQYCKTSGISKDSDVRDLLADLVIEDDINRLFGLRNFWMAHSRTKMSYEGSQSSYQRKMSGLRKIRLMQQVLGYYALIKERDVAIADGWVEINMRASIVAVHPGGTQDIQRVIIARRMGIGRTVREEAGQIPD